MALRRTWRPEQTPLYLLGIVLVASGLFHVVVWLVAGGPLEGAVSWRKPITFGLSVGILALSLGWLSGYLRPTRASVTMGWLYALFMGLEVFLITMQQWRGVASHFNVATAFDARVFDLMGALILAASIQIGWWTWRSFRALDAPPDLAHAIRAGLVLVNVGNLLGIAIIVNARMLMHGGATDGFNILGAAGLMKVPHGLALHALQVLPILSFLLVRAGLGTTARLRHVRMAAAGYALVLVFTMAQTFAGRAPHDITLVTATLGVAGAIALAAPFLAAVARGRAGAAAALGE